MSGGSLNYFYCELESHIGDFEDKELDDLVKDLAQLFHAREWYLSSDTCEGSWNEARDAFKEKWFKDGARKDRIEKYLTDLKKEVLCSLGLSKEYCQNCKHWEKENSSDSKYGNCEFHTTCLMHRSETCERFEKRR